MKKIQRGFLFSLTTLVLAAAAAFGQGNYKVESIGAPPSELTAALGSALEKSGARLSNDQGGAFCEVWLRKSIPTQTGASGSADVLYPALSVGTFVGVLRFPSGGADFRGQPIKAGVYTLRYAQIPQDGNHMGVSPYRDFLLLEPIAADTDLDKALSFDAMVKLSRQASGTGHPAVLTLGPASAGKAAPAAFKDDFGHWILQVQVPAAAGQAFPLAIVLVGKAEA